jgi:hypothetical protein
MEDLNGYYATVNTGPTQLSLSESLYQGLFMQLVGPNMFGLFVDNNFLGVIVLGVSRLKDIFSFCIVLLPTS